MGLKDDYAAGCAIASFEALRSLISLLLLHQAIPKDVAVALLDQALERVERMQAGDAAQSGDGSVLSGPLKAARFQLTGLIEQLRQLEAPNQR